jgi:SAM-dependent methyltransferase
MKPTRPLDTAVRAAYEDSGHVGAFAAIADQGLTRFEAALVQRAFVRGQRILDVGCGGGREAIPMAQAGLRLIALDVSLAMVRVATEYATDQGIRLVSVVASAAALPFRREAFDGIALLGQVIAHVPGRGGRVAALREAWQALRPGGTLVMTTHNRRCHWKFSLYFGWINRWRRVTRWLGRSRGLGDYDRWTTRISATRGGQPVFFHMYDLDEAIADLRAAGFDVLDGRARAEFERDLADETLRRRDYLLGFVARRPGGSPS